VQRAVTFRTPVDFKKQAGVLGNRDMGGYVLSCRKY
jgi:hypothetical protein